MDCLSCLVNGGAGPATDSDFLGAICHGDNVKFPAEAGRYTLYVLAGCPFAARPWAVLAFYGLEEAISVVKCFPASYQDGWFFKPKSQGEHDLVKTFPTAQVDPDPHYDSHHLRELYQRANPDFKGAVSVPLLWDATAGTAVSNSSLGLAKMLATEMRFLGTRNQDVHLFPPCDAKEEHQKHEDLVAMIHSRVTVAVYKIGATMDGNEHDALVDEYYKTLEELQDRLGKSDYLMGEEIRFADLLFFISLVRLDLAYQWRFGLGRKNIRDDYPVSQEYTRRIMGLPGIADTILPRDIMALYFMTLKWTQNGAGRSIPQVPLSWERQIGLDKEDTQE